MSIFESHWIFLVSGYVLPESPFDAWKNGRMVDVPLVVGKIWPGKHTGKCIRRFGGIYAYCRYFIDRK